MNRKEIKMKVKLIYYSIILILIPFGIILLPIAIYVNLKSFINRLLTD